MKGIFVILIACFIYVCYGGVRKLGDELTCYNNNEERKCIYECPPVQTCDNRNIAFSCIAPDKPCENKCVCKSGYYRNELQECVTDAECDIKCVEPNEVFTPCKPTCPPEVCTSILAFYKCEKETTCNPRCVCKPGFLRLEDGSPCIPTKQCPQLANSPDFN